MSLRIDELYAYIAVDGEGNEGVAGFQTDDGWMPMVGADETRMRSLRPIAQAIASNVAPIKLVRFTTRTELETLTPRGEGA